MSRTYNFNATALYGGRGPRNMYLQGFSGWNTKRVGWFKDGSTDYAGAVSMFFNLTQVRGLTIESITLSVSCSGTFPWSVPILYNTKSNSSTTSWEIPNYAYEVQVAQNGTIPQLDVTAFGLPEYDAYVIGGYYRTYSYVDITAATLTVVTSETSKTVTYNANGGTGAPSPTTLWGESSWDGYLSSTVPTRTGYRFDGWNTQSNGSGTTYASGAYITVSDNITLYAKWTALSSVLSSATNANITEPTTVSWTNYGSFTNKLRFIFGSVDSGEIAVSGSSYQYTLPATWYAQIPNSTSGTATVYLYTYVNGTLIGTSSQTFTAYVKDTVVPSTNNPTATAVNAMWGLYLQKYSSVTIAVDGGAAGTGATIKSYSITGQGITYSTQTTATSVSATSSVFASSGTFGYTVTITDSRNRTTSKTVSVTVTEYSEPSIQGVHGIRCDSDGTVNQTTGTSILATADFAYSAVGSNTLTTTLSYKKHTDYSYTTAQTGITSDTAYVIAVGLAEISSSYDVKLEITDSLNNSASYVSIVPPVAGIAFGLKNDRARFGGPVEKAGLQIDWNTEINGYLDVTTRRASAYLTEQGWYRVLTFTYPNAADIVGAGGIQIDLIINRSYGQTNNETHRITLELAYNNIGFVNEYSRSNYFGITKIRYNVNTTGTYSYGYVDIYYDLDVSNPVFVDFNVYAESFIKAAITAGTLQGVAPSPANETRLAEYGFIGTSGQRNTFTPSYGTAAIGGCWYARNGEYVTVHVGLTGLTANTAYTIATLPVGYRPIAQCCSSGSSQTFDKEAHLYVRDSGDIDVWSPNAMASLDATFMWR